MTKQKQKITEEETRKKFHDFMFNEEGCVTIEEARKELNKKYPKNN
ncbi:MAG: hypothetical protein Q7S06_01830 [Nanoarchaeota archaeon]|nr:hypothetical protein [Nanoarchaeota archaeon]